MALSEQPCYDNRPHLPHKWNTTLTQLSSITKKRERVVYQCRGVHKHFLVLNRRGFGWREFACVPHPDRPDPNWACNYTIRVRTSALRDAVTGRTRDRMWFSLRNNGLVMSHLYD